MPSAPGMTISSRQMAASTRASSKLAAKPQETLPNLVRRLSDDAKCANCREANPTHVCLDFQTAVCRQCADLHGEFGHKVKHMADAWAAWEITFVEGGVDQKVADDWLSFWDPATFPGSEWSAQYMRDFMRQAFKTEGGMPTSKWLIKAATFPKEEPMKPLCRATRQASVVDLSEILTDEDGPVGVAAQTGKAPEEEAPQEAEPPAEAEPDAASRLVHLQRDAACFCPNHDQSAKRQKEEPSMKVCGGCDAHLLTNYTSFAYCPYCSAIQEKCMICGAAAQRTDADAHLVKTRKPGVKLLPKKDFDGSDGETPTTVAFSDSEAALCSDSEARAPTEDLIDLGGPPSPSAAGEAEQQAPQTAAPAAADESQGLSGLDLEDFFAAAAPEASAAPEVAAAAEGPAAAAEDMLSLEEEAATEEPLPEQPSHELAEDQAAEAPTPAAADIESLRDAVFGDSPGQLLGLLERCPLKALRPAEPAEQAELSADADPFSAFDALQPQAAKAPVEPGAVIEYGAGPARAAAPTYDPSAPMEPQFEGLSTTQLSSLQATIAQILRQRAEAVAEARAALAAGPADLPDDGAKAGPKPFDDLFGTFCSKNAGWEEFGGRRHVGESEAAAGSASMLAGAADPPPMQRRAARHSIVAMMAPAEEQSSPPAAAPARSLGCSMDLEPGAVEAAGIGKGKPAEFGDLFAAFEGKEWGVAFANKAET